MKKKTIRNIHNNNTQKTAERTQNMDTFNNSSLLPLSSIARRATEDHLSCLKHKTVCRFTLIELLVVIAIIGIR